VKNNNLTLKDIYTHHNVKPTLSFEHGHHGHDVAHAHGAHH
jgi:hypothetical protein